MNTNYKQELKIRYETVRGKIERSSQSTGRTAEIIRLVVVTKTHPLERIKDVIEVGIRELGENYAEEAVEKIEAIGPIEGLNWHMIGHIQSRKADLVAKKFNFIHSLDNYKLAQRLDRFASEYNRVLPVLLECNVSGEESKFGYRTYDKANWTAFFPEVERIAQLPHLQIEGLMTMPPLYEDAEKTRPYFKLLREFRDFLAGKFPAIIWKELSMGTSADYQAAVEEGATIIRVGTAIMGPRPAKIL